MHLRCVLLDKELSRPERGVYFNARNAVVTQMVNKFHGAKGVEPAMQGAPSPMSLDAGTQKFADRGVKPERVQCGIEWDCRESLCRHGLVDRLTCKVA